MSWALIQTNLLWFLKHSPIATTKLAQDPECDVGNTIMRIAKSFPECLEMLHAKKIVKCSVLHEISETHLTPLLSPEFYKD